MKTTNLPQLPQGKHVERTEDGDFAAYYNGMILGYRPTRVNYSLEFRTIPV